REAPLREAQEKDQKSPRRTGRLRDDQGLGASTHLVRVVALGGHPVAFRFVHITLIQGRKVGMFGRRREPGLRPWLKVIVQFQATG
ncbi:hypothetical protein ABZ215_43415, partial [Amycolatopsis sp. NPDC006131]|uniref:hypothetical protein n=1 Tax=Amycolatopsis sp. NPDC006131 TaxID=3156731 RepID=UPI0033B99243